MNHGSNSWMTVPYSSMAWVRMSYELISAATRKYARTEVQAREKRRPPDPASAASAASAADLVLAKGSSAAAASSFCFCFCCCCCFAGLPALPAAALPEDFEPDLDPMARAEEEEGAGLARPLRWLRLNEYKYKNNARRLRCAWMANDRFVPFPTRGCLLLASRPTQETEIESTSSWIDKYTHYYYYYLSSSYAYSS